MTEKRFIMMDVPYENGEPFLYKKMLDKSTKKEYDNTLKGIDDICDLVNKLHEENEQLKKEVLVGDKLELFKQNRILDKHNNQLRQENKELKKHIHELENRLYITGGL